MRPLSVIMKQTKVVYRSTHTMKFFAFCHFELFFLQVAFKNYHDQHELESQFSCSFLLLGSLYLMPQMWGCHREHYHEQFNSLRSVAQDNLVILSHTFPTQDQTLFHLEWSIILCLVLIISFCRFHHTKSWLSSGQTKNKIQWYNEKKRENIAYDIFTHQLHTAK